MIPLAYDAACMSLMEQSNVDTPDAAAFWFVVPVPYWVLTHGADVVRGDWGRRLHYDRGGAASDVGSAVVHLRPAAAMGDVRCLLCALISKSRSARVLDQKLQNGHRDAT